MPPSIMQIPQLLIYLSSDFGGQSVEEGRGGLRLRRGGEVVPEI